MTRQASDNPVFYVQYVARADGLDPAQRHATSALDLRASTRPCSSHENEGSLLRALAEFPRVVAAAAQLREPHRVARYLEDTASSFHKFYDPAGCCRAATRRSPTCTARG